MTAYLLPLALPTGMAMHWGAGNHKDYQSLFLLCACHCLFPPIVSLFPSALLFLLLRVKPFSPNRSFSLSLSHSLSPLPALPAHASLSHSFSPPPYRPCALRLFVPLPSISSLSYHPGCIFSFCCFGCLHPFRGHQHSATMANLTVCWAGELLLLAGVVVLVLDCPLTDHWPQVCPAKRKQVAVE